MKEQSWKIKLAYFLLYFGDSVFTSFLALFFRKCGFTDTNIGILMALIPIGNIAGSLLFAKLSTNIKRNLWIIKVSCIIEFIIIAIIGWLSNFYVLGILTFIFAVCNHPMVCVFDGVATEIASSENKLYSAVRIFGSMGFMFSCLLSSYLLKIFGNNFLILFIMSGCFYLATTIIWLFVKTDRVVEKDDKNAFSYKFFKNKHFVLYLLFYVFDFGICVVGANYLSLYYNSRGMSESLWSFANMYRVLIEILVMFVLKFVFKEKKPNFRFLIGMSGIFYGITYLMISLIPGYFVNFLTSYTVRGFATGFFLFSCMQHLESIVPKEVVSKGSTICGLFYAMILTVGNFAAPRIAEAINYETFFVIISGLCTLMSLTMFLDKDPNNKFENPFKKKFIKKRD